MTTQQTPKRILMGGFLLMIAVLVPLAVHNIYNLARQGSPVAAIVGSACVLILLLPSIYRRPSLRDAFLLVFKGVEPEIDEDTKQTTRKWRIRSFAFVTILLIALAVYLLFSTPLGGLVAIIAVYAIVRAQREQGDAFFANIIDAVKKVWQECR